MMGAPSNVALTDAGAKRMTTASAKRLSPATFATVSMLSFSMTQTAGVP